MSEDDLRRAYDRYQRVEIVHPDAQKEVIQRPGGGSIVRFLRQPPRMSYIAYSRLDPSDLDAAIAGQVAELRADHQPFEWFVMDHDQPPELAARLEAHGFRCEEDEVFLALDLRAAPPALLAPVQADVRPITHPASLEDVIAVLEAVHGGSYAWIRERLAMHMDIPGYISIYVAYVDSQPVSVAWIYFYPNSPFAGLWAGATLEPYRGRGLYSALLATRAQEAIRRAYRYLYLNASDMSQPIVKKLGFQVMATLRAYEWVG